VELDQRAYAPVNYYLPSRRVWTTTEELDAFDRARSRTAEDVLSGRGGDEVVRAS